jgi:redox-sensitive bicupin YhaK (pirin superfamily)
MFPLVNEDAPNPLELFQIWLNLPKAHKLVEPHFEMLWRERVPMLRTVDDNGKATEVNVIAGALPSVTPPVPPPKSWAADPRSDLAIWTLTMEPGATATLPRAKLGTNRVLYFFRGTGLRVGDVPLAGSHGAQLRPDVDVTLRNTGAEPAELLLLQGRPLGEPVAQSGPFVMNTEAEVRQAFADYRATGFGGWRWASHGPVHSRNEGRFARHPDGVIERAG